MITFCCQCGKTYKVEDKFAGRTTKCQQCGQAITVPASSVQEQAKPAGMPVTRSAAKRPTVISVAPRTKTDRKKKRQPRFLVGILLVILFLVIGVSTVFVMMERSKTATANKRIDEMKRQLDDLQQSAGEKQQQLDDTLKVMASLEDELNKPEDYRKKLKEIEAEIKEKGGYAIAGQVFIDDKPASKASDIKIVACEKSIDNIYENGWFISDRRGDEKAPSQTILAFDKKRTALLEMPIEYQINNVNFYKIPLVTPPESDRIDITGKVVSEEGNPVADAEITLFRDIGNYGYGLSERPNSKADGTFVIPKMVPGQYSVTVRHPMWNTVSHPRMEFAMNSTTFNDIILTYRIEVSIDVVYQPDGSTDFTQGDLKKGEFILSTQDYFAASWDEPFGRHIRLDSDSNSTDLSLNNQDDNLKFHFNGYEENIAFEFVENADPEKCKSFYKQCWPNHVYVVKTREKGHYAKLVVRKIEILTPDGNKEYSEFESVNLIPGESEPQLAPRNFLAKLKEIETEIKEQDGFAVAGQVVDENNDPLDKAMFTVALKGNGSKAEDTYRFDRGWFITQRQTNQQYDKIVAATFQHLEQEVPVKIEEGKVVFQKVTFEPVPQENLTTLSGVIRNEDGIPIPAAQCELTLQRSNGYFEEQADIKVFADAQGRYAFADIPLQEYRFYVRDEKYHGSYGRVKPDDSQKQFVGYPGNSLQFDNNELNVTLSYPRKVTFDIVYQPDGSTSFTNENIKTGRFTLTTINGAGSGNRANWGNPTGVHICLDPEDSGSNFNFGFDYNRLELRWWWSDRENNSGAYDLGELDFESITEAEPDKIKRGGYPCELNHVYVIRTYKSRAPGNYAKIIIRNIEAVK